jgi:cytochrome c553
LIFLNSCKLSVGWFFRIQLIRLSVSTHKVVLNHFFPLPKQETFFMKHTTKVLAVGLLALGAVAAHAQVNQVRVWAAACANCHGTDGRAVPGMDALAGKDKNEIVQKMLDYKNGRRPATLMHQIAKGYTDEQINEIAAYFAAQKR